MQSILLRCEPCDREALVTELWEQGTAGILEEDRGLRAFFEDGAAIEFFKDRTIEIRAEERPDPSDFPKQDWDPIAVGKRFWIAPSWVDGPTPPGRIRLAIESPNAFGTGRHESTQLALEALEEHVTACDVVLDIGSGSGILSQAAHLLGARKVFSCDIHDDAIAASQAQLRSHLFQGSADAIRGQIGDVVVANISAKVIDRLAWELNRISQAGWSAATDRFHSRESAEGLLAGTHYRPWRLALLGVPSSGNPRFRGPAGFAHTLSRMVVRSGEKASDPGLDGRGRALHGQQFFEQSQVCIDGDVFICHLDEALDGRTQ